MLYACAQTVSSSDKAQLQKVMNKIKVKKQNERRGVDRQLRVQGGAIEMSDIQHGAGKSSRKKGKGVREW